jgi:hypothetical protein
VTANLQDYLIMPNPQLNDGDLSLRAVCQSDIEAIRQWRNAQMDVLRQNVTISKEAQQRYFEEYVWEHKKSLYPNQILLAIELGGCLIGYGGLVNMLGKINGQSYRFCSSPISSKIHLLEQICFQDFCGCFKCSRSLT